MDNDLIAMIFSDQQAALDVLRALERMRTSQFLGPMNLVPVTRDRKGIVTIHLRWQPWSDPGAPGDQMPGIVANAIFGISSEEEMPKLIDDADMSESFLKKLEADLVPGSSMVLAYIRRDTLVDTQQFLDAISRFKGTVCQTTVSDEVEQVIMKQLGSKKPSTGLK
jgi:uncharacterized membrane protein